MEYGLMETPFMLIPFYEMNKKQAEQYFQWFMLEKENRIHQLEQYAKQSVDSILLDKTPESLVDLWEWFEEHIEWEDKSEQEIEDELKGRPDWMKPHILADTKKMTVLTLALGMDISIYFGETLICNNPSIYWGYRRSPKKLDGVNRPILLGFKGDVCVFPYTLIKVCIMESTENKDKYKLLELYNIWCKNV
ncbi:MAG: hypothetical protein PHC69_00725 [Ruminiclostridium sp.]|nr:hypothetical protein [Ruminiclostridium sp.]